MKLRTQPSDVSPFYPIENKNFCHFRAETNRAGDLRDRLDANWLPDVLRDGQPGRLVRALDDGHVRESNWSSSCAAVWNSDWLCSFSRLRLRKALYSCRNATAGSIHVDRRAGK